MTWQVAWVCTVAIVAFVAGTCIMTDLIISDGKKEESTSYAEDTE
jgi:hypothetical protein